MTDIRDLMPDGTICKTCEHAIDYQFCRKQEKRTRVVEGYNILYECSGYRAGDLKKEDKR